MPRARAMVMLGEGATGADAVTMGLAYKCVEEPAQLMSVALEKTHRRALGIAEGFPHDASGEEAHVRARMVHAAKWGALSGSRERRRPADASGDGLR